MLLLAGAGKSYAQVYQAVFPNQSGAELYDSLVVHFKPDSVLDYANARDTLYARILVTEEDSIHGIYSDHVLYLDPTQDPTQYIYLNGISLGMNTEHVYPQSKGAATGNPRSDMHHIFPARIPVNEARGDLPYAEIPDAQTTQWFYKAQVLFSTPAQNKDLYSEANATAFEPREAVKGDLARAIFYFYTMYRAEADLADPNYFELQRATLCQWHIQDPADSSELIKTWRIAPYQANKPNPFILDCTLAHRLYCPEITTDCSTTSVWEHAAYSIGLQLRPNPLTGPGEAALTLPFSGDLNARLISFTGVELAAWRILEVEAGIFYLKVEPPGNTSLRSGILEVQLNRGAKLARASMPVLFR